jgi:hypothetical protein
LKYLNFETHTSDDLGEEEEMDGLVNGTLATMVRVNILSGLVLCGQTSCT